MPCRTVVLSTAFHSLRKTKEDKYHAYCKNRVERLKQEAEAKVQADRKATALRQQQRNVKLTKALQNFAHFILIVVAAFVLGCIGSAHGHCISFAMLAFVGSALAGFPFFTRS